MFAFVLLAGCISILKSYPSVGDAALFHSLLFLFPHLLPRAFIVLSFRAERDVGRRERVDYRHPLLTVCLYLYSSALLPAFHHLWLYAGSGNANFYYASTLIYSVAGGALVVDALWACLRREFLSDQGVTLEQLKCDDMIVVQS